MRAEKQQISCNSLERLLKEYPIIAENRIENIEHIIASENYSDEFRDAAKKELERFNENKVKLDEMKRKVQEAIDKKELANKKSGYDEWYEKRYMLYDKMRDTIISVADFVNDISKMIHPEHGSPKYLDAHVVQGSARCVCVAYKEEAPTAILKNGYCPRIMGDNHDYDIWYDYNISRCIITTHQLM